MAAKADDILNKEQRSKNNKYLVILPLGKTLSPHEQAF